MDRNVFDVAELVGKYLAGNLTEEERESLEKWVAASKERASWFEAVTREDYQRDKFARVREVDVNGGWRKVQRGCFRRRRVWTRLGRWAALILLPMLGACLVYLHGQRGVEERDEGREKIEIGSSKARLILADGKSITLEQQPPGVLAECDGTRINLESEHVTYENEEETHDEELVYNELLVPKGGEYSLTLSDGTVVFLNAESRLRFPVRFGKSVREVELEGEGYFEVARDTNAEFVVRTRDMRVKVLGTVFNISAYENDDFTCATLVEGSVEVTDSETGKEVVLRPNEQALVRDDGMFVEEVDVSYAVAWKDGRLRFQEKPLWEIMKIVSRWYDMEVEYGDEEVKDYAFGCNFNRHAAVEDLLAVFERTGTIDIDIQGTKVFISKKR